MDTLFPFSGDVAMRMSWENTTVQTVSMRLNVRIPSWLPAPLAVFINGQQYADKGKPGTYLAVDRHWTRRDCISFTLPTIYRLSLYTGVDQVPGFEGRRYALLVGPI